MLVRAVPDGERRPKCPCCPQIKMLISVHFFHPRTIKKCANELVKKVYRELSPNLLLFYYYNKSCMVDRETTKISTDRKSVNQGSWDTRTISYLYITIQYNTIQHNTMQLVFTFGLGLNIASELNTQPFNIFLASGLGARLCLFSDS